jgi:molybdopterin/thiamine biosynthesis adenylyltransferase
MAWYLNNPKLYKEEKETWGNLGFLLNTELLDSDQRVEFIGSMTHENRIFDFKVTYPVGFPHFSPRVICTNVTNQRHQTNIYNTLCLLEDWVDNGFVNGEQLIERLHKWMGGVINGFKKEDESEAPELELYDYASEINVKSVLVAPTNIYQLLKSRRGIFDVNVNILEDTIQAEFVSAKNGEYRIQNDETVLLEGVKHTGIYLNTEQPPRFKNEKELLDWLIFKGHTEDVEYAKQLWRVLTMDALNENLKLGPLLGLRFLNQETNDYDFLLISLSASIDKVTHKKEFPFIVFDTQKFSENLLFKRVAHLRPLKDKRVVLVGLGAVGSPIAIELAKAGVGKMSFVDPDIVDIGNVVRHEAAIEDFGRPKCAVVSEKAFSHNPFLKVDTSIVHIGHTSEKNVYEIFSNADCIVCAVGHSPTERYIDEVTRRMNIPVLYAYASAGAYSGRVFRVLPNETGCYHCHQYAIEDGTVPPLTQASEIEAIYSAGCAEPSYPGSGVDTSIIANFAARLTLQTLLKNHPNTYEPAAYDHLVWVSQSGTGKMELIQRPIPQNPKCPFCELEKEINPYSLTEEGERISNIVTN